MADCSRYLKMPFSKANLPSNNQTLKGTKESFWITSFLCSTKLTQNGKLSGSGNTGFWLVFPYLAAILLRLSLYLKFFYLNTLVGRAPLCSLVS